MGSEVIRDIPEAGYYTVLGRYNNQPRVYSVSPRGTHGLTYTCYVFQRACPRGKVRSLESLCHVFQRAHPRGKVRPLEYINTWATNKSTCKTMLQQLLVDPVWPYSHVLF